MTLRYVGPGGNDGNDGLSWVERHLTLGSIEGDVAAGDTVYMGPGAYRESLLVDNADSGTPGNPITYVGDVTGENTDGIGGIARITGLDDDTEAFSLRDQNILFNSSVGQSADYRTFRGITFDSYRDRVDNGNINWVAGGLSTNIIIEDCVFMPNSNRTSGFSEYAAIRPDGRYANANWNIRRNLFWATDMAFWAQAVSNTLGSYTFENNICFMTGFRFVNVHSWNVYGNTFIQCGNGIAGGNPGASGANVHDNLFINCQNSITGTAANITRDYNIYANCITNLTLQTNELETHHPFHGPLLIGNGDVAGTGIKMPWDIFRHSDFWQYPRRADSGNLPADDFYGLARPTGSGKGTPGALQWAVPVRDTQIRRQGPSSVALPDAQRHVMYLPTDVSTTYRINVWVRRQTNYAGTSPQLLIRRVGESDTTITDGGSSGSWNKLTANVTMSATGKFMQIHLISNNTASSGDYQVNFDSLDVKRTGS